MVPRARGDLSVGSWEEEHQVDSSLLLSLLAKVKCRHAEPAKSAAQASESFLFAQKDKIRRKSKTLATVQSFATHFFLSGLSFPRLSPSHVTCVYIYVSFP